VKESDAIPGQLSESRRLEFSDGQKVGVQWPNGNRTDETVRMKSYFESIPDMGHSYDSVDVRPNLSIEVNGLEVLIDNFKQLKFKESDLRLKQGDYKL